MTGSRADRWLAFLADRRRAALLAAAVGALVYANALALGFAYDDVVVIEGNQALHSAAGILRALGQPYWPNRYAQEIGAWRPVVSLSWGLEWLVWGNRPALFHLVGVLAHAAAAALVVLVLAELMPVAAAALAGLVFAVHPVHVEAVANTVGHAEVYAAVFMLAACLLHLRRGDPDRWSVALPLGALFALGALSKEIAYTLPAVIFLIDAARRDVTPGSLATYVGRRWRTYVVLGAVGSALLLLRSQVLGGVAPPQVPGGAALLGSISRVWTVPGIWPHYLRLMLFPLDLSAEYGGIVPVEIGWGARNLTGAFAALALLGLALWAWRRGPMEPGSETPRTLGFAVVWFGLTVLPASNVLFLAPVLLAERNLYTPSIGFAAAAGWVLAVALERRPTIAVLAVVAALSAGALRTVTRTPVWTSNERLIADLLDRHPEVPRSWLVRGDRLFKEGRQPEARRAFAVLLLLNDSDYQSATEVGARLSAMDRASPRAAAFLLARAWKEEPGYYTAPGYLAAHHLNHGEFSAGEPAARAALLLAPDNLDMERVLAGLLSGQGRAAEAIPYRLDAIARGGGGPWRQWVWLADDYLVTGDTARAGNALDSARVRAPGPDVVAAIDARRSEIGAASRNE